MKKIYVIIILIAVLYFCLMYFLFIKPTPQILTTHGDVSMIIGPNTVWKYENKRWKVINNISSYDNQFYNLYIDNKLKGTYELGYMDAGWNYYEKDCFANSLDCKNYSLVDEKFIAIAGDRDVTLKKFKVINVDKSEIREIMKELHISESENMKIEKIVLDLDNDKTDEEIYIISNVFMQNEFVNKYYSILLIKKGKKIMTLYKNITDTENENCDIQVPYILDMSVNKKYSIISQCMYNDLVGSCHELYEWYNGEYKRVIKCKTPTI